MEHLQDQCHLWEGELYHEHQEQELLKNLLKIKMIYCVNLLRYGSPARQFDWGYPGTFPAAGGQNGQQVVGGGQPMQGPGGQTSAPPATADVIAAQSQDYVDENLAAFQVKTS